MFVTFDVLNLTGWLKADAALNTLSIPTQAVLVGLGKRSNSLFIIQ
jgi:hypothetical protein